MESERMENKNSKIKLAVIFLIMVLLIVVICVIVGMNYTGNKMSGLYKEYQYPNEDFFGKELYSEIDYKCTEEESRVGSLIMNKAVSVSDYSGKEEDAESTLGDVGELSRYYYYNRQDAASQEVTLEFITCKITENTGHVWVVTKQTYYDFDGKMLGGSNNILTLWSIENKEGEWCVVQVKEAP